MEINFGEQPFKPKPGKKSKNAFVRVLISLGITALVGLVYFYFSLPAINPQAPEFYAFILLLLGVYTVSSLVLGGASVETPQELWSLIKKQFKLPIIAAALIAVVFVGGNIISMPIFRSGAYRDLLKITTGDFATDVAEVSFNEIPMLDKDSAERLGDRKLGELSDMVSQFEVANDYTQINYQDRPVRVTPLVYGDFIKWFNNRKSGLPAYLVIDMNNQNVEVKRLSEGMKYSESELFGRYLDRKLRFAYPTLMFADSTFEIDEEGNPYWIAPRIIKKIGLFGGVDVNGAVLLNAVTGESKFYEEVPTWVDRLYPAELIDMQYNYYGTYINGFINSIFGQKGVTKTTQGYNYIAMNDDVFMYTGITSVGGDQSNIGFILSNQRTKETKYFTAAGADEYSARASAEGVVQHLGYKSTFPILLNISGQPTYFLSLKDNAQLVKKYAMVNVSQYQVVATGDTVIECEHEYLRLMAQHGITKTIVPTEKSVEGVVSDVRTAVKEGTSFYYINLENDSHYYVISAVDNEAVILVNVGDKVQIDADENSDGDIRLAYGITKK